MLFGVIILSKDKLLSSIGRVYDEIYNLERDRVELNKKILLKKARLNAILNHLRLEYK